MREYLIAGNWKMNLGRTESVYLARELAGKIPAHDAVETVLIPTFVHLDAVHQAIASSALKLGAQDVYHEKKGAFTGEISPAMLKEVGVQFVLVGHSERRHILGETDALLNQKTRAAIAEGLTVVLCVGETLPERQSHQTNEVVARQLAGGLAKVDSDMVQLRRLVIAYEPVWAIGTGLTATPQQAQAVHSFIRQRLTDLYGTSLAQTIRIQYGGSVRKANAADLLVEADIYGLLVGGASLAADEFADIVRAAEQVKGKK